MLLSLLSDLRAHQWAAVDRIREPTFRGGQDIIDGQVRLFQKLVAGQTFRIVRIRTATVPSWLPT
jgi:hypothetical protein